MTFYLHVALMYIIVGFGVALVFYYGFRKPFLGRFWGALVVGLIGSFLGGVLGFLLSDFIEYLSNLNNINIFPPVITAFIVMWIFSFISSISE
jgi:uncharacterized membrane protein YeaQ/YmgE (transglycosylase-associated protein family)